MKIEFDKLPKRTDFDNLELVLEHAEDNHWNIVKVDYNTGMIRFQNGGVFINLYTTSFTISTEVNHPKKGKTQLHRKGLMFQEVLTIFNNPREHTGKGYYTKKKNL